jgi:hypothetical protein
LRAWVFPVLVETTENRIDDPVHAFDVGEDGHGPSAPADFDEAALDPPLSALNILPICAEGFSPPVKMSVFFSKFYLDGNQDLGFIVSKLLNSAAQNPNCWDITKGDASNVETRRSRTHPETL